MLVNVLTLMFKYLLGVNDCRTWLNGYQELLIEASNYIDKCVRLCAGGNIIEMWLPFNYISFIIQPSLLGLFGLLKTYKTL